MHLVREGLLKIVEETLDEVLPRLDEQPSILFEAMRYAVGTGGKRIRPLICLASSIAAGGTARDARYCAAAIELLHNYTLVHDDLPSMDNDTERRGKPTVWKKFGESTAILAGDALIALAYQTAARTPCNVPQTIAALGEAGVGVVMGQVEDIRLERSCEKPDTNLIDFVYRHKTADLFVAAAKMGALAAGADDKTVEKLASFALNLGLAFQYQDDLLDADGAFPKDLTEKLATEKTAAAISFLDQLEGDTSFLRNLANLLVGRNV